MSKALSLDLCTRALAAVGSGASHRAAAARFGVSAESVSRWRALERAQGDARPGPLGGNRRSDRVEAQASPIRQLLEELPDVTAENFAERLESAASGSATARSSGSSADTASRATIDRPAREQERPDVLIRRRTWFDERSDLDRERLVFIDESEPLKAPLMGWTAPAPDVAM